MSRRLGSSAQVSSHNLSRDRGRSVSLSTSPRSVWLCRGAVPIAIPIPILIGLQSYLCRGLAFESRGAH